MPLTKAAHIYNGKLIGSSVGTDMQVDVLPTASASEYGKVYQFIGTTGTYTHGYFYECTRTGTDPNYTYAWTRTNTQPSVDVSGKADKPSSATSGNFASFDANKNPVDSGKKASDFAASSHNHSAADINSSSTFGAQVKANATAVQTLGTSQVRNIYAGTSDMTAGTSALTTGDIYLAYE